MSLLQTESLTAGYGGLVAVDHVDLTLRPGEIRGLIGPNGAGKTTLFNVISGLVAPSQGRILMAGEDITELPPHKRALLGIRRTFQTVQLVQTLTVYENLLIGLPGGRVGGVRGVLAAIAGRGGEDRDADGRIEEVLRYVGIESLAGREVRSLSFAEQRYVEIARALVARPKLVMFDEPAAGLTPPQIAELDGFFVRLNADWGVTILLVEHVVSLVLSVCERITVLDQGRVIAEGTAAEILADRKVKAAYLGEEAHA